MSDPYEKANLSLTLKKDGKDASWIVFHGSVERIREDLGLAFGLETTDLKLVELANNADQLWKATGNAGRVLGARSPAGGSPAWEEARTGGSEPAVPVRDPLFDTIEATQDAAALKQLWAENRPAFDSNEELMSAWKARGKAIKEASA